MKQIILTLTMVFSMLTSANAMSYEQAREQALFLTDKMAYELNLTEDQYEAAYEVNLDYLMSVNDHNDVYAECWTHRNLDLSYILFDWQYRLFCDAAYFYRPLSWYDGYWHFGIYARYPHRTYFYFSRPRVYVSYRGGHSWHTNGGRSWYNGRHFGTSNHGNTHVGMRDNWDRRNGNRNNGGSHGNFGTRRDNTGSRDNSGRGTAGFGQRRGGSTVGGSSTNGGTHENGRGSFGGNRGNGTGSSVGDRTVSTTPRADRSTGSFSRQSSTRQTAQGDGVYGVGTTHGSGSVRTEGSNSGSRGSSVGNSTRVDRSSSTFSGASRSSSSMSGSRTSSFGSSRSSSMGSSSMGSSRGSSSMGSSRGGSSMGGGSRGAASGGSHGGGFGGRR